MVKLSSTTGQPLSRCIWPSPKNGSQITLKTPVSTNDSPGTLLRRDQSLRAGQQNIQISTFFCTSSHVVVPWPYHQCSTVSAHCSAISDGGAPACLSSCTGESSKSATEMNNVLATPTGFAPPQHLISSPHIGLV